MADARSAVTLDLEGLQGLLDVLSHMGFTVLGPTVRNGAVVPGRLSSIDDLPRGWGICRSREATGCGGGTMRRCSGTPPMRLAGSPCCFRPVNSSGRATLRRMGSASTLVTAEMAATSATRRTPYSEFGPATCTRSRSTTGCCETGPTQTCATRPGERTRSSSLWSAPIRAGPASASPWEPVPARSLATTSR